MPKNARRSKPLPARACPAILGALEADATYSLMRLGRSLAIAAGALVLLGAPAGYSAYWFALAGQVEQGIARWEAQRRAEGYTVAHGPAERGGFPFALAFTLPRPHIARPDPPLEWRAETLTLKAKPWALKQLTFDFPGKHTLAGTADGQPRLIDAVLGSGSLDLLFDGRGRADAAALNAAGVDARLAGAADRFQVASIRAVARRLPMVGPGAVSLETDSRIAGLVLPERQGGPLGRDISLVSALANVIGQAPEDGTRAAAIKWRDSGGYVEIKETHIVWGKIEIKGSGTARLDADLQPNLRLDSQVRGGDALIDALLATGQMRLPEAIIAKGVLGALSRPAGDGGPPVLRVPITVRDGGRLYLGPVRIWRFAPLVWRQ
jgi:hypothetical protein